jgi:putative membrane protein
MHAKLGLVAVLLLYFILAGRMLKRSIAGGTLPSGLRLRLFNELPVFVLLAIIYLVLAKPF